MNKAKNAGQNSENIEKCKRLFGEVTFATRLVF